MAIVTTMQYGRLNHKQSATGWAGAVALAGNSIAYKNKANYRLFALAVSLTAEGGSWADGRLARIAV